MKKLLFGVVALVALVFQSCAPHISKMEAYKNIYEEKPVAIMIMPPINRSVLVDAKMSFYNTLAMPLADNGYYSLPPSLSPPRFQLSG